MAPDVQSNNEYLAAARGMEPMSELKRSSRGQQGSNKGKEKLLAPRGSETIKYPDKLKSETQCSNLQLNHHLHEQGHCIKGKATTEDELVRHMSNLPDYLQRMERGENRQALNVGVLDWTRLEKWKLNQISDTKRGGLDSMTVHSKYTDVKSRSSSLSSALHMKTATKRSDLSGSSNPRPTVFDKDGLNHCARTTTKKVMSLQDTEYVSKCSTSGTKRIPPTSRSLGDSTADNSILGKDSRKEPHQNVISDRGNSSVAMKNMVVLQDTDIGRSDHPWRNVAEKVSPSISKQWKGMPVSSFEYESNERVQKEQVPKVNLPAQPCSRKPKSIVLLLPRRFPQSNHSEILKQNEERTISSQRLTESYRNSLSDSISSDDFHSREFFPEFPRSCPLSSQLESQCETIATQPFDAPSSLCPDEQDDLSAAKCCKQDESESEAAKLSFAETLKRLDLEQDSLEVRKSRNPSPNRRFSFSLGRMTRSFSFKESTSIPQLGPSYVSAKSGPVTTDATPYFDISSLEKANTPVKSRSSPLRRLLDPLLKSKSMSFHNSSENIQPSKPRDPSRPVAAEKNQKLTVQALLQLTMKNGHPLFKFVVDNNSNVLAATMKSTSSSGKDGSGRIFTFYSVDEIKKKSISWIGQGNKGGGFAYNVVGQMKLSHSPFSGWTMDNFGEQCITKECVLSSIDSRGADKELTNFTANKELAAIIFNFTKNLSVPDRKLKSSSAENSCSCDLPREDKGCITVILPGDDHGMPIKGEPSPLIDRWRSGGTCDCGGWDIGCKLRLLSSQNNHCKGSRKSKASISDHLELWVQGEAPSNKSVFSLSPFRNGIYSIEFDSSISLLQAFSISVAFTCCQIPSDPSKANCSSGVVNTFPETTLLEPTFSRNRSVKASSIFQTNGRTKYAPCPPLSPVGRV